MTTTDTSKVLEAVNLPDDVIEYFRKMMESTDSQQWVVGDEVEALLGEFDQYIDTIDDVEQRASARRRLRTRIINQLADRIGADRSTLRDRHSMAKFFPQEVREKYRPLTYHQLRACKAAGSQWQEYADWALDNLPAPVAVIRARISNDGNDAPAWEGRVMRMMAIADSLIADKETPPPLVAAAKGVLSSFEYVLAGLAMVLGDGVNDTESSAADTYA